MPEEQRFLSTLKAAQRSQQKLAAVQAQVGQAARRSACAL